ncbi:MAG: polyprenyl synthetase family protein [Alphaproteobacteria bacterium]|nr:polyprenyl synthetase family protein [Alphaproteobacteria bacterium]
MQVQLHRPSPTGLHAGAPRTFIQPLPEIVQLVAAEMAEAERQLRESLASTVPAVAEIGRYLAGAGGKRLRPLLTGLGARAAGHAGPIARLMCVGELVHLGSLLHDDVVDSGIERRGLPAAQRVYGNPGVILTGDFCVARGLAIAADEAGLTAATGLARTVAAMSEGEIQQLLNAGRLDLPVADYYEVIDKKSASLIAWCASAGAWAVGNTAAADALAEYGRQVGLGFQIADDVLDYIGKRTLTGKPRGLDLAQRKPTLPLLLALDRVDGLRERLAAPPADEELDELLVLVRDSGAVTDALRCARQHVSDSLTALAPLPDSPAKRALVALAHHLVERTR